MRIGVLSCVRLSCSFTNLLIHTPWLEEASAKYLPPWLVSTAGHIEHHRKLSMNYAAPTLNVDHWVRASVYADKMLAKVFGKAYLLASKKEEEERC